MPNSLENGGLIDAIKQLIEITPIKILFKTTDLTLHLDKNLEIALYRVLQEFINNTLKHAKASLVSISVSKLDSKLEINISDDGVGFKPSTIKTYEGRGMHTMKSRIESFGGEFSFHSEKDKGVQLNILFYD